MNRSKENWQRAFVARAKPSVRFAVAGPSGRPHVALFLLAAVVVLWPNVSLAEVNPLTGLYRLQQTDLTVRFQATEFELTRQYDGSLPSTDLDNDGWTLRPLDKRILLVGDARRVFLQNGAEVTEFVRDGDQGDYTCHRNEQIVPRPAGFMRKCGDGTAELYDKEGKLTRVDGPGGPSVHLTYLQGRLATISAAGTQLLQVRYDPRGLVERVDAYNGVSATYRYDDRSQLVSATDQDNITTHYQYDTLGRLSRVRFQTGDFVQLDYAGDSIRVRCVSTRDGSAEYAYQEDAQGQIRSVTITRPTGTETYAFEGAGTMVEHTDVLGNRTIRLFEDGRLIKCVDGQMDSAECQYDSRGRLAELTRPDGGVARIFYWGDTSLPAAQVDPDGATTHYAYNDKHQLLRVRGPGGREVSYTYNSMGLCDTITYGVGEQALREQFQYDDTGLLVEWKDSLGRNLQYEHDSRGRIKQVSGSTNDSLALQYDQHGLVSEVSECGRVVATATVDEQLRLVESCDRRGLATRLAYDTNGRLKSVAFPTGARETYEYDQFGRLATILVSDGAGRSYGYNELDLLSSVTIGDQQTLHCQYDAVGRLVEARAPDGAARFKYDSMGRPVLAIDPSGARYTYSYDSAGRLITERNNQRAAKQYRYNAAGDLAGVRLPNEEETRYTYDPTGRGHLVAVLTSDGRQLRYAYDPAGRLIQETTAWGETIDCTYDADDNAVRRTSSTGSVIDYQYDQFSRQVKLGTSDGYHATYEYDEQGDLVRVTAPGYEKTLRYDPFGRLTAAVYPLLDKEVRYTYDKWDRRMSLEIPGHLKIAYDYDDLGRLANIDYGEGNRVKFAYDDAGRRSEISYPNGITVVYAYDAAGPVSRIAYLDRSGHVLGEFCYERDLAGRVVSRTDLTGHTDEFRYDMNGQLVQAISEGKETSFEYASGLRRIAETAGGETRRFQYNEAGQMVRAGDAEITYDGAGNMASRSASAGAHQHTFDALGRLSRIQNGPHTTQYTYSPDGDRIVKEVDGKRSHYLYDGLDLLLILDEGKQPVASFVHGPGIDAPLAMLSEGRAHYYLPDHLGSIVALCDAAGEIVSRYSYGPFGRLSATGRQTGNPFAFTARFYDPESGLYYYRARYYDPRLGVFLSPDPFPKSLDEPKSFSDYAYVCNDPVNSTDPLGWRGGNTTGVIELIGRVMEEERIANLRAERAFVKWEMRKFWGWQTPRGKVSPTRGGYTHWQVGHKIHEMRRSLEYLRKEGFEGSYQVQLQKFKNQLRTHYLPRRVNSPQSGGAAPVQIARVSRAAQVMNRAKYSGRKIYDYTTGKVAEAIKGPRWSELTKLRKTGRVAGVVGSVAVTALHSAYRGHECFSEYQTKARSEGRAVTWGEAGKAWGKASARSVFAVVTLGGSEVGVQVYQVGTVLQARRRYSTAKKTLEESPARNKASQVRKQFEVFDEAEKYFKQLEAIRKKQTEAIAEARKCATTASACLDRLNACKPLPAPSISEAKLAQAETDQVKLTQVDSRAGRLNQEVIEAHDRAKSQAALAMRKTSVDLVKPHVDAAVQAAALATSRSKQLALLVSKARALKAKIDACVAKARAYQAEHKAAVDALATTLSELESDVPGLPAKSVAASKVTHACADEAATPYHHLNNLYELTRNIDVDRTLTSIVELAHSGAKIYQQIKADRKKADADSRQGETFAKMTLEKFKTLRASLERARSFRLYVKLPRASMVTDLESLAANAEILAARARAYADQAQRYLAALSKQPDKAKTPVKVKPGQGGKPPTTEKPPKTKKPAKADDTVPALVGKTPKEALGVINKRWEVAWIGANEEPATKEEGGKIAAQMPAPGAQLEKGSTLRLDVYPAYKEGKSSKKVEVPILVGQPAQKAENELLQLGLGVRLLPADDAPRFRIMENTVAAQSIAARTRVKTGTLVTLTVYGKVDAEVAKPDKPKKPDTPARDRRATKESVYRGKFTQRFVTSMLGALNENPYVSGMQVKFSRARCTEMTLQIQGKTATITPVTVTMTTSREGKTQRIIEKWQFRCDPVAADDSVTGSCSIEPSGQNAVASAVLFFGVKRFQWKATRQGDVFTLRFIFPAELVRQWSQPSADSDIAYVKKWQRRLDDLRPSWRLERVKE